MNLKNILFLCNDNSIISQMAEGLARNYFRGRFAIHSAGMESQPLKGITARVMNEIGIDISSQSSKTLESLEDLKIDAVIALSDETAALADEQFGEDVKKINKTFFSPLTEERKMSQEELLDEYRTVRDSLREFVEMRLEMLL